MFDRFGVGEVLIILAVALLFFGPKKLPEVGKGIGQAIREFKNSAKSISEEVGKDPT